VAKSGLTNLSFLTHYFHIVFSFSALFGGEVKVVEKIAYPMDRNCGLPGGRPEEKNEHIVASCPNIIEILDKHYCFT